MGGREGTGNKLMDERPEVQTSDCVREVDPDPAGLSVGLGARRA